MKRQALKFGSVRRAFATLVMITLVFVNLAIATNALPDLPCCSQRAWQTAIATFSAISSVSSTNTQCCWAGTIEPRQEDTANNYCVFCSAYFDSHFEALNFAMANADVLIPNSQPTPLPQLTVDSARIPELPPPKPV